MTAETLGAIWIRLREGMSRRGISETLGLDKKTVNRYAERIQEAGIPESANLTEALPILAGLLGENRKGPPARTSSNPFETKSGA
jgi:hypothetical protein